MPQLLHLPADLLASVLQDWVEALGDLSALDVACGRRPGGVTLEGLGCSRVSIASDPVHLPREAYIGFLGWTLQTGLRVTKVTLHLSEVNSLPFSHFRSQFASFPFCTEAHLIEDNAVADSASVVEPLKDLFPSLHGVNAKDWPGLRLDQLCALGCSVELRCLTLHNHSALRAEDLVALFLMPMCQGLRSLSLTRLPMSGVALQALARSCRVLESLTLCCDGLESGAVEAFFAVCAPLRSLKLKSLREGAITDREMELIASLHPNLEQLDLVDARLLTFRGLKSALVQLPRLTRFRAPAFAFAVEDKAGARLALTIAISESALLQVLHLPFAAALRHLDLRCYSGSFETVADVIVHNFGPSVHHLRLPSSASLLCAASGRRMFSSLPALRSVEFQFASGMPDDALRAHFSLAYAGLWTSLAFTNNEAVTDTGIACVLAHCPRLEALSIVHCRQVTDATLDTIRRRNRRLSTLTIRRTACTAGAILSLVTEWPCWKCVCVNHRMEAQFKSALESRGTLGQRLLSKVYFR